MKADLAEIRKKTVTASDYIERLEGDSREKFLKRKENYQPKQEAVNRLKQFAKEYFVVAFSAEWCKDCAASIPVLAVISETTGLEIRVFGGLKKDPLSKTRKWRVPPSPPEVETFDVDKIPLIIIFDAEGNEVERIVENPKEPTLEEELLKIILSEKKQS
ncbi:MAG: thioredoxin family protein [Candidatus Bathyarchaeales archaeon]